MFLVMLAGFSRTFYLRPFTGVTDLLGTPGLPWHLYVHGLVMTSWFAFVVAQTWLVRSRRTGTHRRIGMYGAALAAAVIVTGVVTVVKFAPRAAATQFDSARAHTIVIGDLLVVLVIFPALVGAAIWFRHRPDTHKRLMLLACASIFLPVLSRSVETLMELQWPIWPVFLITPLTLVIALFVYDVMVIRRLHAASIWGGLWLLLLALPPLISSTPAVHALVVWLSATP